MHDNPAESALKSPLDRGQMKSFRPVPLLLFAWLGFFCSPQVLAQNEPQTNERETNPDQHPLKLLKSPPPVFPAEALKKNVEGKVELSLIVDADGHVTDAKVLSGPPELYESALDNVKQWQFAPPAHAPAETRASIAYGHPRPCPATEATIGGVIAVSTLTNDKGKTVEAVEDTAWQSPRYYFEDMKAGAAGDMVLSVTINANGKPTKVRVVHSLSPHLDKAAIKAIRTWRFKLSTNSPGSLPDAFPMHIKFEPECPMDL
jgi:TonB family protein